MSPVFVSHSSVCMAAIVSPAAGTNPSLFWTQGDKQRCQPTICIPVPYLCGARGRRAEAGPHGPNRRSTVRRHRWTNTSPWDAVPILKLRSGSSAAVRRPLTEPWRAFNVSPIPQVKDGGQLRLNEPREEVEGVNLKLNVSNVT